MESESALDIQEIGQDSDAVRIVTPDPGPKGAGKDSPVDDSSLDWDEFKFPEATVVKIAREAISDAAVIAKDTKAIFKDISAFFVIYLTECASSLAAKSKRKTLLPRDIFTALKELGYEDFVPTLEKYLQDRTSGRNSATTPEIQADDNPHSDPDEAVENADMETQKEPDPADSLIRDLEDLANDLENVSPMMNTKDRVDFTSNRIGTAFMDSDDED